jgi:hypothetical protein
MTRIRLKALQIGTSGKGKTGLGSGYRQRSTAQRQSTRIIGHVEFESHVSLYRPPLWSSGQSSWLQNGDVLYFP